MADYIVERQTHIMVATNTSTQPLYPSDTLYPADDLYPRDAELVEVNNIVAGSMQLDEMLVDKEPILGLFFSSKFECQLYDTEEDFSGRYIHVYQTENGVRRSVFTGYVDSCKRDKVGTDRTLIAYDLAYHWGSVDVSGWWNSFWELPEHENGATVRDIRNSLIGTFKFQAEDIALPNDDKVVPKTIGMHSASFASIMMMLCEISCCYPHFDRDGILRFIILDTSESQIIVPQTDLPYDYLNNGNAYMFVHQFYADNYPHIYGETYPQDVMFCQLGFYELAAEEMEADFSLSYTVPITIANLEQAMAEIYRQARPYTGEDIFFSDQFRVVVDLVGITDSTIVLRNTIGQFRLSADGDYEIDLDEFVPSDFICDRLLIHIGIESPDPILYGNQRLDYLDGALIAILSPFKLSTITRNAVLSPVGIDLTDRYEWNNSDFEVYETNPVTGIQFFDSEDQLKYTVGSDENAYGIHKNVFLYDAGTEELEQIGQTMLNYLKDFRYTPSNVKMIVGDLSLHLGDRVSTEQGTFYIFQNAYSGSQLIEQTIKAEGTMELDSVAKPINFDSIVLAEKISRVQYNVEAFYIEYQDVTNGMKSEYRQTASEIRQEVSDKTTSAYIITKINQNGDDEKIVSSVEIGADVIDIQGIVSLLEAEEIRTVLNGDTGSEEPSKFIKYTGNSIEFFEGSYDDYDKMAELSYNGLDYYRNNSPIGRYTVSYWNGFGELTNLAVTQNIGGGGLTVTKDGVNGITINGTSDETVSTDLTVLQSFNVTAGKAYRFSYKMTNMPSDAALQFIYMKDGQPQLICNAGQISAGKFYTFRATTTGAFQIYMRKGKKAVTYNNTKLTFTITDVAEEAQRQYGLGIQLLEGDWWGVSKRGTDSQIVKLFYASEDIYSDKAHTTKQYDGDTLYAFVPFEFSSLTKFKGRIDFQNNALLRYATYIDDTLMVRNGASIYFGGDRVTDITSSLPSSTYTSKARIYGNTDTLYFDMGTDITYGFYFRGYYNNAFYNIFHWNPGNGNDLVFDISARGSLKTARLSFPGQNYTWEDSDRVNGWELYKYYANALTMCLGYGAAEYWLVATRYAENQAPTKKLTYSRTNDNFYFYAPTYFQTNLNLVSGYTATFNGRTHFKANTLFNSQAYIDNVGIPNGYRLWLGGNRSTDITSLEGSSYNNKVSIYSDGTTAYFDMGTDISYGFYFRGYYNNSFYNIFHWNPNDGINLVFDRGTTFNQLATFANGATLSSGKVLKTEGNSQIQISDTSSLYVGSDAVISVAGTSGKSRTLEVGLSGIGAFTLTFKKGVLTDIGATTSPVPTYNYINLY